MYVHYHNHQHLSLSLWSVNFQSSPKFLRLTCVLHHLIKINPNPHRNFLHIHCYCSPFIHHSSASVVSSLSSVTPLPQIFLEGLIESLPFFYTISEIHPFNCPLMSGTSTVTEFWFAKLSLQAFSDCLFFTQKVSYPGTFTFCMFAG